MSDTQKQLSELALTIFELNGKFLSIAEQLTKQAGITATRWQVLGAVLDQPLTQADIARKMGITRQSVQRTSMQLITAGLIISVPNPNHKKASLLTPTESGLRTIDKIGPLHKKFSIALINELGQHTADDILNQLKKLNQILNGLTS